MSRKKAVSDSSIVAPIRTEPLLVPVREAARLLGFKSTAPVRRLIRAGLLKYKEIAPKFWMVQMASIRAYANSAEVR
jgi:hypothetical protein